MRCQSCGSDNTNVIDSRESKDGLQIRRRRACLDCQWRFTTYEKAVDERPIHGPTFNVVRKEIETVLMKLSDSMLPVREPESEYQI